MKIPTDFIVHGHKVTVSIISDIENGSNYGQYNDAKEEILIAQKVKCKDEWIELTETQLETTFLHELVHVLQFHSGDQMDEMVAQTYSGLLYEYLTTANYK
jgi:hypothetical protein